MDYIRKINKTIADNNGIITSQEVSKMGIPSIYITRLVKKGVLERIAAGIYLSKNADYDEYYIFYLKNKKSVFSFSSALYLHDLTDRIPFHLEITLPNTYNSSHIDNSVIIHKVIKKFYDVGRIMKETIYGNLVSCYDMERTICDIVRFRDKMDVEIFSKAVKFYVGHKDRDYHKLKEYAKIFNISRKINELLDVIICI